MLAPFRALARRQIERAISDPVLRAKVTPTDEVGCKRLMLTDEWYPTLTKPNVELIADRVTEVTATGIRTDDGVERPADVIVMATGFNSHGFVAPMEITGAGVKHLGGLATWRDSGAGLHLMLALRPGLDEAEALQQAAAAGVCVGAVAPCWVGAPGYAALLLGYTALPLERIDQGLRRLAQALGEA